MKTYHHFKGGIYRVLFEAIDSETGQTVVVYRDDAYNYWVRPYDMFHSLVEVEVNGQSEMVPRFEFIGEN